MIIERGEIIVVSTGDQQSIFKRDYPQRVLERQSLHHTPQKTLTYRRSLSVQEGVVMLVLSRNANETIVIGEDIRITVLRISRDKVRLGIECPRNIPVHREEVKVAIDNRKKGEAR